MLCMLSSQAAKHFLHMLKPKDSTKTRPREEVQILLEIWESTQSKHEIKAPLPGSAPERQGKSGKKKGTATEGFKMSQDLTKQQVTNTAKIYSAQEQCGNASIASFTFCTTTDHKHIWIKCMVHYLQLLQLSGKSSFCCVYTGDTGQELTAQGKPNCWSLRTPSPFTVPTEPACLVRTMRQHTTCKTNTNCPFSWSVSSPQLMVSFQPEAFSPSAHIMILILQLQSPSIHSGKEKKRQKDMLIQSSVLKTHCGKCFKRSHSSQDEWTVQVFTFLFWS